MEALLTSLVEILSNSRSTYHIPDTQPSAPAVLIEPEWGVCVYECLFCGVLYRDTLPMFDFDAEKP